MAPFIPLLGAFTACGATAAGTHDALPLTWRSGEPIPHLELRVTLDGARALALPAGRPAERTETPPCIADVCQARVEVPGFTTRFGRPSRSELAAALLDRMGVEPFATLAWIFVATGLRVDWSPPVYDAGEPAAAKGGGWGTLSVRLKLRIDAANRPVVPDRRHARGAARAGAAHRPARRSNT